MSARIVLFTVFMGFGLAPTGCGSTQKECSASNCLGCCGTDGVCRTTSSTQFCGSGGLQCAECLPTQICQLGTCVNFLFGGSGGGNSGGGVGGGNSGGGTGGGNSGGGTGGGNLGGGTGGGNSGGGSGGGNSGGGTGGGNSGGGTGGGNSGGGTGGGNSGGGTGGGNSGGGTGGGISDGGVAPSDLCDGVTVPLIAASGTVTVNGDTSALADNYRSGTVNNCDDNGTGGDAVYRIEHLEETNLLIQVSAKTGSAYHTIFYLRTACSDPTTELACYYGADQICDTSGAISKVLPVGTYYLIVDSCGDEPGPYSLTVSQ